MSLTRSLLKELQISPDAAERIIAAHAESIDALRQERDAARGEAAQLESIRAALAEMTQARDEACQARDSAREDLSALGGQFDSYRQQVETEKHQQARHANLRAALQSAGANPHALDLLLLALHPDESAFDGDEITDPDALLTPLKAQYGAFFAQPTRLPTDVVSPPVTAAPPLTKEDVRRMSQEDINRNWSSVCSVLSKGD